MSKAVALVVNIILTQHCHLHFLLYCGLTVLRTGVVASILEGDIRNTDGEFRLSQFVDAVALVP